MSQNSAGRLFMRATFYENMLEQSDQEKGLPQPPLERPACPSARIIPLPAPSTLRVPPMDIREAMEERHSVRAYADESLSMDELSWLLWATQGVRKVGFAVGSNRTYRTVPSAGGRHPFETYLVVRSVKGLPTGIYRFLAIDHKLEEIDISKDFTEDLARICRDQQFMQQAAATFVWMADEYRSVWRYRDRAYRGIFQDSGHVAQNLYLAAAPIGCGVCGIGAFDDLDLSRLLGADGIELFTAYAATVGKLRR